MRLARLLKAIAVIALCPEVVLTGLQQRYEAGGVSQLTRLDDQRLQLSASLEEIAVNADRYADSAALFQAMGDGWWMPRLQQ